jgi:hypothetical protein
MRKVNRTIKALVVILVVGIGLFHNVNKHSFLYEQIKSVSVNTDENLGKSDSLQVKESNFYIYTKRIIDSGIQHLISTI